MLPAARSIVMAEADVMAQSRATPQAVCLNLNLILDLAIICGSDSRITIDPIASLTMSAMLQITNIYSLTILKLLPF